MERRTMFLLCTLAGWMVACGQTRGMRQANIQANQHRVALVIGNARYDTDPLRNPDHDASIVSQALKETGFQVLTYTDLNQKEMKKAIRTFGEKLSSGGVALFYYSGHGVQVKGSNYLIPISADIRNENDVELEAVDANYVLNEMDAAKSRVNIVILDACRDNPLPRTVRSTIRGLAQMNAPVGTIIAFSTAPGSVASDGTGQYGLYMQEFVKNVKTPGLPVETVFKRTLSGVKQQSGGNQIPWTSYSIEGDFYFIPPSGSESTTVAEGSGINAAAKPSSDSVVGMPNPTKTEIGTNYALQFTGRGGSLEVRPSAILQPQNLTVEVAVKFDELNSPFIPLLEEQATDHRTSANGFSLQYESGQFIFRLAKAPDAGISVGGPYTPVIGKWVHIAGTYDGYVMRIYIDGELQAETPFPGPAYYGSRGFCLGVGEHGSFGGTNHFRGQMDELRIWNVVRSPEDVRKYSHQTLVTGEAGLVAYWNFDQEFSGGFVPDQSAFHNIGLIEGDVQRVTRESY